MIYTRLQVDLKLSDPIHFVLVLDDSDSMFVSRRKALFKSVKNFMQIRHDEGNPADRVTIILFANNADIEVFSQPIHPSIIDQIEKKISDRGRWTDFGSALKCVIKAMNVAKAAKDFRKFGIVFMSIGWSISPRAELLELKENWLSDIYNFWCIGFDEKASRFDDLREMCKIIKGDESTFMNPQDEIALENDYVKIARKD